MSFSPDAFLSFASAVLSAFAYCKRSVHSGFLLSLPVHPLEVAGSFRFVLCYAPLFSFSVFFHPMPNSALHQQFYPLLLTANAPFTPISSITTLSPFRGCREKKFRPLLRTIV